MIKLAILTCICYLAITVLIEAGIFALATLRLEGAVLISLKELPFGILFGIVWLVSFSLAWRILFSTSLIKGLR